jgi:hypothetical protein
MGQVRQLVLKPVGGAFFSPPVRLVFGASAGVQYGMISFPYDFA